MIKLTGKTFDHRDILKEFGGRWNSDERNWHFYTLTKEQKERLSQLPGCILVEDDRKSVPISFVAVEEERPTQRSGRTVVYGDDQRYLNYFKDKNPTAFFGFSNLKALTDFIKAIPERKRIGTRDAGWQKNNAKWYGSQSMEHALEIARDGWQEGVENASRVVEFISLQHAQKKRRAYSVAGGTINVGRMLSGNPAHMVKRQKAPGRRIMTLFVENTASGMIKADTLVVRAAVCGALTDILEQNGYSCEIIAVTMQSNHSRGGAQTAVTIKHAGEKLNISDLVFSLGHPSFLRRFNFACISQADELQDMWETQGYAADAFNSHYQPGRNELYIRCVRQNVTEGSLEDQAIEMLSKIKPDDLPIDIGEVTR